MQNHADQATSTKTFINPAFRPILPSTLLSNAMQRRDPVLPLADREVICSNPIVLGAHGTMQSGIFAVNTNSIQGDSSGCTLAFVDFDFRGSAMLPKCCRFCQICICPGRIGKIVEVVKSKSTEARV